MDRYTLLVAMNTVVKTIERMSDKCSESYINDGVEIIATTDELIDEIKKEFTNLIKESKGDNNA